MPQSTKETGQSPSGEVLVRAFRDSLEAVLSELIKERGFTDTLKAVKRRRLPEFPVMDVYGGVLQESASGKCAAALETDRGRVVLQNADRTDRPSTDPQWSPESVSWASDADAQSLALTTGELVEQLSAAGRNPPTQLLCAVELARFATAERDVLLPLLWQYILEHRNSNDREELVAVAAAIRKYIAVMPIERMGELAVLLESGHRSPLPVELEIEVAKMVYRNFEVHPPVAADPQPELAQRFWEMVEAYVNPRVLVRDKCSAAASLAIEAIVAMRSPLAEAAWRKAMACPYRWFGELVSDEIDELHEKWRGKDVAAASWLDTLRGTVLVPV